MSNTQKLRDVKKLLASKCYILITDKEAVLAGDFKGFTGMMKMHSLKLMVSNAEKLIQRLQGDEKPKVKEKPNGRNTRGRKASSPKK